MSDKDPISKLTEAVTTLNTEVKVECAKIVATQDSMGSQLGEIKVDLEHVKRRQLGCPARTGWDQMTKDVDQLEDDTKQITIAAARRNGKDSRTPRSIPPDHLPKKQPNPLLTWIVGRLGIALALVTLAGLNFLVTTCTDNSEVLEHKLLQQQEQMERVRQEVKVVGAAADVLAEEIADTEGEY